MRCTQAYEPTDVEQPFASISYRSGTTTRISRTCERFVTLVFVTLILTSVTNRVKSDIDLMSPKQIDARSLVTCSSRSRGTTGISTRSDVDAQTASASPCVDGCSIQCVPKCRAGNKVKKSSRTIEPKIVKHLRISNVGAMAPGGGGDETSTRNLNEQIFPYRRWKVFME